MDVLDGHDVDLEPTRLLKFAVHDFVRLADIRQYLIKRFGVHGYRHCLRRDLLHFWRRLYHFAPCGVT